MDQSLHSISFDGLSYDICMNAKDFVRQEVLKGSPRVSYASKRSAKSSAWKRFVRVLYDQKATNFAKCVACDTIVKYTPQLGTAGLLRHKCPQINQHLTTDMLDQTDALIANISNVQNLVDLYEPHNSVIDSLGEMTAEDVNDKKFIIQVVTNSDREVSFKRVHGTSKAWNYFQRIYYKNIRTEFVKCMTCDNIQKHTSTDGTGGLLRHKCFPDNNSSKLVSNELLVCDYNETESNANDTEYEDFIVKEWRHSSKTSKSTKERKKLVNMIMNNDQRLSFVAENGKSKVWERFDRIFFDDKKIDFVKCKICHMAVKHTSRIGTKGLIVHKCRQIFKEQQMVNQDLNDESDINYKNFNISSKTDPKSHNSQLVDEIDTLKLIVQKCLQIIDNCVCDNKYSKQRKDVNILLLNLETLSSNNKLNTHFSYDLNITKRVTNAIKRKYIKKSRIKKQLPCDWPGCDKTFIQMHHLKEHLNNAHMELKDFICEWPGCEEKFIKPHKLKYHIMKQHTNEKPYKCDECSYSALFKAVLKRHQRIHATEKALICDWPGCDFKTNHEHVLKTHKFKHSGQKPFKCSWPSCDWSFRQKHHLKAHMLKHTGERPVVCEEPTCDRRFTSRQAMRFHLEKIHRIAI
ncbi:zinc finger protein 195-like [Oppia nitens]|uniref:zinc finger protein 195-like n=1 Tax=Oppia nitens TaxID=1686743 RepID=UPI0023DB21D6|nr:zinc finger protein 195-like [Oppia nitens]